MKNSLSNRWTTAHKDGCRYGLRWAQRPKTGTAFHFILALSTRRADGKLRASATTKVLVDKREEVKNASLAELN